MAKKKKKKKPQIHPLAMGSDWLLLMITRFSEKSKKRSERKYKRKKWRYNEE